MHLLLAQKGSIADGEEAIDLGQTPGDVLFLSAADTELAALAAAVSARPAGPSFRLASLMSLKHPMSVDTYVERSARHARLIVVRALGGASYFHYALEALHAAARRSGAVIVVLPGDDKPDPGLDAFNTCSDEDRAALWSYLVEGGDANARAFVDYAAAMLGEGERPGPAAPLLKAGIWWPGLGAVGVQRWQDLAPQDRPVIAICFYRALVQSGETRPVEAMIEALAAQGPQGLAGLRVQSQGFRLGRDVAGHLLRGPPVVVINTTGFAVSAPGRAGASTVLDEGGAVVCCRPCFPVPAGRPGRVLPRGYRPATWR